ncbi:type II secretion system protein [Fibrobacter sp.]|uniref:type II secretion system protein n=1 Tax=Fibrobacter sp. TaxID=35828 RepID=UPI003866FB32
MLTKVLNSATRNNRKAGFTLVELMVVIIIVNLLSGVAVPKLTDMIERTRQRLDVMKLYYLRDALNRALYEGEYDDINEGTYGSCGNVSKAQLDSGLKYGLGLFIIQRSSYMPANYQGVHSSAKTNNMCGLLFSGGFWSDALKDAGFGAVADIIKDRANGDKINTNSKTYTAQKNDMNNSWWRTYPTQPIFVSNYLKNDPTQVTASNASIVLYVKWAGGNPQSHSLEVYFATDSKNGKGLVSKQGTCFSTLPCR